MRRLCPKLIVMDNAWVEAEYFTALADQNPSRWIGHFSEMSRRSANTLDVKGSQPYGSHSRQTYDFYPAKSSDRAPTLIYFHGGYWTRGCKEDWAFIAECWVLLGANVIIPDYRIAPHGTLQDMCEDVMLLIRHLNDVAGDLEIYADNVVVSGHSAGGHLGALAAQHAPQSIRGACLVSGLFDLRPLAQSEIGRMIGLSKDNAKHLSPAFLEQTNISHHFFVGQQESGPFIDQSRLIHHIRRASGCDTTMQIIADQNHFSILRGFGDPKSEIGTALKALLGL